MVYLNDLALRVLDARPTDCGNLTACVFADVTGEQVFQDLRHTAALWLRMEGAGVRGVPPHDRGRLNAIELKGWKVARAG